MGEFVLPIDKEQINALDLRQEADSIQEELLDLLTEETYALISKEAPDLIRRIDACIFALENKSRMITMSRAKKLERQARKELDREGAKDEAYEAIRRAQDAYNMAHEALEAEINNFQLKAALQEGYIIINKIRELFFDEIQYKIMAVGKDKSGQNVLFESNPDMIELLENTVVDSSGALKITANLKQFQKIIEASENADKELKMANTVLNQMQKVQMMRPGDQPLLDLFTHLKVALDAANIKGGKLNYGQVTEAYLEQFFNGDVITSVENVYDLLEKGMNNLEYYFGGDIQTAGIDYQVKTLSFYGSTGRADAATLSNVLHPLRELREILTSGSNPQVIKESLKNFFVAEEGRGDRKFNAAVQDDIKDVIKKAMQEIGFELT